MREGPYHVSAFGVDYATFIQLKDALDWACAQSNIHLSGIWTVTSRVKTRGHKEEFLWGMYQAGVEK